MTREQAAELMDVLNEHRALLVEQIKAIRRKRSWSPAARAMAEAERFVKLDKIKAQQERIGTEFNLGGW